MTCIIILGLLILNGVVMGAGNVLATVPLDTAFSIAVNPTNQRVYVGGDSHIYVIDSSTNTLSATLPLTGRFFHMAVNTITNRFYAVDTLSSPYQLFVLKGSDNSVITQVEISGSPNGLAVDSGRNLIYVTNGTTGELDVIDGSSNAITDTIAIGSAPGPVVVNSITNRIYVAYGLNHIAVVNGNTKDVVDDIAVDNNPVRMAVNTFTNKIYAVTNYNYVSELDVVDGDSNTFIHSFLIPANAASISVNSITNRVYIAMVPTSGKGGSVLLVDGTKDTLIGTLPIGKMSLDIGVDSATSRVYTVTVIGSGTQPSIPTIASSAATASNLQPFASQGGDSMIVYQDILPVLVAPVRNFFRMRTPTLTWEGVDWALGYEIEVDNNSDFKSNEYHSDTLGSSILKATTNPLGDGIYYWRVRAKVSSTQWGAWSVPQTFQVNA
ncbi:MAG: YncE family protein [Chloroflexota bacterium]